MDELKDRIASLERNLTVFYLRQIEELSTLKTQISRLDFQPSSDNKLTTVTYQQFLESVERLQSTSFPPQALLNHPTLTDDAIIAVVATDGSRKEVQGKPFASSSAIFGTVSPLNLARFVLNTSSTLHPEVDAIILALQTASKNSIKNILVVSDSHSALKFLACSLIPITSSIELQNTLSKHPDLADQATAITNLLHNFNFIGIHWQKSHTSLTFDIFAELNQTADSWARNKVDEIAATYFSSANN